MKRRAFIALLGGAAGLIGAALAEPAIDPDVFKTKAAFSVDERAASLSTAIATIEPRTGAPGYSWLRINFYGFAPDADDIAAAVKGNIRSMEAKFNKLAANPSVYNTSWAFIQLTLDNAGTVWQVDMSVPGHGCTIAPFEPHVAKFLQDYRFDGRNLRLKSKGSYVCDMSFFRTPDQTFSWDIDLSNLPVFAKAN